MCLSLYVSVSSSFSSSISAANSPQKASFKIVTYSTRTFQVVLFFLVVGPNGQVQSSLSARWLAENCSRKELFFPSHLPGSADKETPERKEIPPPVASSTTDSLFFGTKERDERMKRNLPFFFLPPPLTKEKKSWPSDRSRNNGTKATTLLL